MPAPSAIDVPALLAKRAARSRARAVRVEIDDFDNIGPLRVFADILPITPGGPSQRVHEQWEMAGSFTISIPANYTLPIRIRAYRYPIPLAKVDAKETERVLDPADVSTWTTDALLSGSAGCALLGYCVHEDQGYTCPPAVEIQGGDIKHANDVWVIRRDGPPVEKSRLEEVRVREAADRLEQARIAEARRIRDMALPVMAPISVPLGPHPAAEGATVQNPNRPSPPPPPLAARPDLIDERAKMPGFIPPPPMITAE